MKDKRGGEMRFGISLDRVIQWFHETDGLCVNDLQPKDLLTVKTHNSLYRLEIIEPGRALCLFSRANSELSYSGRKGRIWGSALLSSGGMLKIGWVVIGARLVIGVESKQIVTSPVKDIRLNNVSLPRSPKTLM